MYWATQVKIRLMPWKINGWIYCKAVKKKDKRQKSGIESDSLPGRHNRDGNNTLKMKKGEKYETENRRGLSAECPARRQRRTEEKLVLLDKYLANLKELRRLNLRRHNQFNIVPVSHCSPAVELSHSANWATFGIG